MPACVWCESGAGSQHLSCASIPSWPGIPLAGPAAQWLPSASYDTAPEAGENEPVPAASGNHAGPTVGAQWKGCVAYQHAWLLFIG